MVRIATLVSCIVLSVASACSRQPGPGNSGPGKKKVVATFTIIADMAREVAGTAADVASITKPGAEIHEYEPTPGDLARAGGADLILDNGLNLERWFERFLSQLGPIRRVVVSEGVEPMSITEGPYDGKPNPHAWMSPKNAMIYAKNIHKALVAVDPANEKTYSANLAAYTARLAEVDGFLAGTLRQVPERQRVLATSEGAFTYLCRDYGIKELYLWPVNADQEGTPRQVQAMIDAVRERSVPAVFSESTISDKPMKQVAQETGARYAGVLYVDSLTDADGPAPTFLALLEFNARAIAAGLNPAASTAPAGKSK